MKILILNWRDTGHPLSGGAEIVTMEHARGWVRDGHAVTWFTSWYPGARKDETIHGVRMVRRAGSLTVYPSAMGYVSLHGGEYDVIVDEVHGFPFFSVLFTRTPVVVFIHEIAGIIWDFMFPFPVNAIGKFLEHRYFRLYRHCQFWTDAPSTVFELVDRGIPKKQCHAIPCPIIRPRVSGKRWKKEADPTYLFVSRVVKMKGIEEVIKAFSFIVREQQKARLWIVGSGEDRYVRSLRAMAGEYGVSDHVTFFGSVAEAKKFELMARAHILLHASVKEGWGLVVLEAASVGTPAVVYNVGGLKDTVLDDKTGIVISNNSPKDLAEAALRIYAEKRRYRSYQQEGKRWVDSIRWVTTGKQVLGILETAAATGTH